MNTSSETMAGPGADRDEARAMVESWAAFWADSGVDLAFEDDARDWIAEGAPPPDKAKTEKDAPRPRPAQRPQPEAPRIGGKPEAWPADLAAFRQWWLSEPSIDLAPPASRVAPIGPADAGIMVLVSDPAADDGQELLSGADGRLIDAMLRAMGMQRADAYLAPALPRHTPAPDWQRLHEEGLGALLRHHIALANPKILTVFGIELVKMLAPERFDPATMQGSITVPNGGNPREIPLLASYPLAVMGGRPRAKALWWQRWLSLSRPS